MSQAPPNVSRRLDEIEERLALLWSEPASLRLQTGWLARVWLRVSGPRGEILSAALGAFRATPGEPFTARWMLHRDAVIGELEENVRQMERSARVDGEVAAPILTWLFGVHRWARGMERTISSRSEPSEFALTRGLASRALLAPPPSDRPGESVALSGVDALLNEAAQEVERVARRRRLLEAARRVLLDAEARFSTGDHDGWSGRRRLIAEELTQLKRMEMAGVDPQVDLTHQLRRGVKRGRAELTRACAAIAYVGAERRSAGQAADAIRRAASSAASVPASSKGLIPPSVEGAVEQGYRRAREANEAALEGAMLSETVSLRRRRRHVRAGAHLSLIRMALGVDGVFDVGGGLERDRVDVVSPVVRLVPFPTAELELRTVEEPTDVGGAIIEDPRLLLYDLASRRLLQRRYVHRTTQRRRQDRVRAAVRFYLLDGSSSMEGPRARMRDALLIAELASLVSRLERRSRIRSLLYYRYFNSSAEVTRRVAAIDEALEAIEEVLGTGREGGTDIERALTDSIELIERQRDEDVELSRAQIVLVTDGEAPFDPALITAAQERLSIPVRVSVIALGEESPALRSFAAEQRAAGLKVLYHHVGDAELQRWEAGQSDEVWPGFELVEVPSSTVGMVEDIEVLAEGRAGATLDPELLLEAMRDVGLGADDLPEGTRAKMEAASRDTRSLDRRFDRLFPELTTAADSLADPADDELTIVLDALGVVIEVLALTPSDVSSTKSDAIAIFERLLRERGLTPTRFLTLVDEHPAWIGPGIVAVREACGAGSRSAEGR